jgi:hypothetical protein
VAVPPAVAAPPAAAEASRWDQEPVTAAEDLLGRVKVRVAKGDEVAVALDPRVLDPQEAAAENHPEARRAARVAEKADRLAAVAKLGRG